MPDKECFYVPVKTAAAGFLSASILAPAYAGDDTKTNPYLKCWNHLEQTHPDIKMLDLVPAHSFYSLTNAEQPELPKPVTITAFFKKSADGSVDIKTSPILGYLFQLPEKTDPETLGKTYNGISLNFFHHGKLVYGGYNLLGRSLDDKTHCAHFMTSDINSGRHWDSMLELYSLSLERYYFEQGMRPADTNIYLTWWEKDHRAIGAELPLGNMKNPSP